MYHNPHFNVLFDKLTRSWSLCKNIERMAIQAIGSNTIDKEQGMTCGNSLQNDWEVGLTD